MTIYVLVEVTYDYYRFQENISASVTSSFDSSLMTEAYPLLAYTAGSKQNKELDHHETKHYWIQEFKVTER